MPKIYKDSDFMFMELEGDGVQQCINCGAFAITIKDIQHFSTCNPGENDKWKKYYSDENDEGL